METELGILDTYFAKTLLNRANAYTEEAALFLASLMKQSRIGHLCMRRDEEISLPSSILGTGDTPFPLAPVIRHKNSYYLQKNWVLETHILQHIRRLNIEKPIPHISLEVFSRHLKEEEKLLPEQKEAIRRISQHSLSLICGGPGTGKTHTATHLVRLIAASLDKEVLPRYRIALAAPTGKAANHLHSALLAQGPLPLHCQAFTLHRLLRLHPLETRLFNDRRIDADLILVDEASMIDVPLLAHLLGAIGGDTRLILMGDADQLPPIDTGSLFSECADLFGVRLNRCMRTEKEELQIAADAIRKGEEFFDAVQCQKFEGDWVETLYEKISPLIFNEKPNPAACLEHYNRCRILNALRQGPFGAEALNQSLVEQMERRCANGQWWAIPILVTENLPRIGLYNGSSGILIGQKGKSLNLSTAAAYFLEKGEEPLSRIPPFEVSFCLSIHKSQGSEFDRIIALFPKGSENFGREALYTAATRAKKGWEVVGEEETLREMLKKSSRRMSGFTGRLSIQE